MISNSNENDQVAPNLKISRIIRRIVSGEMMLNEVRAEWPAVAGPWSDAVYQAVEHYVVDADIRARDPRYQARQQDHLLRIAERLADGLEPYADDLTFARPRHL
ncbi:MAG: hypothetical protein ACYC77_07695 [Coriobacteriia bacterium]